MKIVATLGPASKEKDLISKLAKTANRFRLNTSHLSIDDLRGWLDSLRSLYVTMGKSIPVVLDLQGEKYRIGKIGSYDSIAERVKIFYGASSSSREQIPVPEKSFFSNVSVGDLIKLNDAKIVVKVNAVDSMNIDATVIENGPLSSYKGINKFINENTSDYELTDRDTIIIKEAMNYEFTEFALSFVRDGKDAKAIRTLISDRSLIAKIERVEAMSNIKAIDDFFDEIWFCRGDLGAEAGLLKMAELQNSFISNFNNMSCPKYLAGQVLEHMTSFSQPTRSEVVHLYDSIKNGFDGIVLSDETAIGKNPIAVMDFLSIF
ncbi:MAG: pyruvate kinase [bacterium]